MMNIKNKHNQSGFTLVELAIVMIIIGLLIGGILKGQELVANAQITATIAQIKGLDGALSTFRDKYSAMPGDMANPQARLRDCNAAPCNVAPALSNGRIDGVILGDSPTNTMEGVVAFPQMAAADLIAGVSILDNASPPVFGGALPEAKIGGGFWIGYTNDGNARGALFTMRPGHYLVINGTVEQAGGDSGMTATQAAQIDRKMDDGASRTGDVQSAGGGCQNSGVYNESTVTANCSVYVRVQG